MWLLKDRAEKHRRLRSLPDAGRIGEFVVISGSRDLPEGSVIPVSWEGVLGSVRSCDVCVPCSGIRKRHLSYSFRPGTGLLIHPLSGCEALVNSSVLNCHSPEDTCPMTNGSFLQAGSALLRLRLFTGLDPFAAPDAQPLQAPPAPAADSAFRTAAQNVSPAFPPDGSVAWQVPAGTDRPLPPPPDPFGTPFAQPGPEVSRESSGYSSGFSGGGVTPPSAGAGSADSGGSGAETSAAPRRRRSERWEADWSD